MNNVTMKIFYALLGVAILLAYGHEARAGLQEANDAYRNGAYPVALEEFNKLTTDGQASVPDIASAQYMLGVMYANGQGVTLDYRKAALWYYKAGVRGNASAQYRLGVMYVNGQGVTQNYREAVVWYRKAAEQGNAMAQFNLGVKYANGQGVTQNPKDAVAWYSRAAEQGLANAQNNLGVMFYNGQGVQRNLMQAYKWVSLASASGDVMAVKNKKVAEAEMSPGEIAEAQLLIRDWLTLHGVADLQTPAQDVKAGSNVTHGIDAPPVASSPSPVSRGAASSGSTAQVRIEHFQVKGNTLLESGLIERLLNPLKGENRSYADIQGAMASLEGAYRSAGYGAVRVITPKQDITNGTVTFQVFEAVVDKVTLNGNRYYDNNNIRNSLPALTEGSTPSARALSENLRLANENPTRQMEIVFSQGKQENTVDAEIDVQDSSPHKVFATLDNTGSPSTGMYRIGVGYQHNNLFNRDQAMTLNYITSPGHVSDVTQLSGSYRFPLYALGDSMDLIAAHSGSDAGTSPIVGGYLLTFSGKGNVYGVHYNHFLPRNGDYASKIIAGLDYRSYFNNCLINGTAVCGAVGNDLVIHPLSITYGGTLTKHAYVADYSTAIVHNLSGGVHGGSGDFSAARGAGAKADYSLLRFNGSLTGVLPKEWQYRVAGNMQYTRDAIVSYEDIGLVGANAVRGFIEREVSNDKGIVVNFELYTPDLIQKTDLPNQSFRLLGFIDRARGWNVPLPGEVMVRDSVGSMGFGLRYSFGKNITTRFDLSRVTKAGSSTNTKTGDKRGQFGVMVNW